MLELRSGRRRRVGGGRAQRQPVDPAGNPVPATGVRTRAAAKAKAEAEAARNQVRVLVVKEDEKRGGKRGRAGGGGGRKSRGEERKQEEEQEGEEAKMGDSGGLSANRDGVQEEEGNTAPFPDKVYVSVAPC